MFSRESLQPESFDIRKYRPSCMEEVVHIGGLTALDFRIKEGDIVGCAAGVTPRGVIILDIKHGDYPDDTCQIQCSPDGRDYNVFNIHWPLREGDDTEVQIPEELVKRIFYQIFPQVESRLQVRNRLLEMEESAMRLFMDIVRGPGSRMELN